MGKVLKHMRPQPFSPPPVLTFQELWIKCKSEAPTRAGEDELAVALVALESQDAIVRFGFGPSACYSLSQQLLKVTAVEASAGLTHSFAIDDHITEISEPGNISGFLMTSSRGDDHNGAHAEQDSIVLVRRRIACKIPSDGIFMRAAETSRMRRAAKKRSTAVNA